MIETMLAAGMAGSVTTTAVATTETRMRSAGSAPHMLPEQHNGPSTVIVDRPCDQLEQTGGRYWD